MKILLSNDDGVNAPGLLAVYNALSQVADVTVMAPDSERSGSSSALTITRPLQVHQLPNGFWAVNGTPADCVYLACHGFFDQTFDLVVSGINSGANLGDDVVYSGTVGAALEGRLMQTPAIAISLAGEHVRNYISTEPYMTAANWLKDFITNGIPPLPARHIYNINVPDVENLAGVQVTCMGQRQPANPVIKAKDPRGKDIFWIGLAGKANKESNTSGVITDFDAIAQGCVSITPIQIDATSYSQIEQLSKQITV